MHPRSALCLAAVAFPLAVFSQDSTVPPLSRLAVAADGGSVLFQSRFGRKGFDEAGREKIFRWGTNGIYVEVTLTGQDVVDPQLSDSGAVFAFATSGGLTTFRTGAVEFSRVGQWRISRNGNWAYEPLLRKRIDLRAGIEIGVECSGTLRGVVNDGRVLCSGSDFALLWSPEHSEMLPLGPMTEVLAVDPSGTVYVVLVASFFTEARRTGSGTVLARGGSHLDLPDAGTWLTTGGWPTRYDSPQVFRTDLETGATSRLTDLPEGVRYFALSPDRRIAFVSTGNRLGRLTGGQWEELVPRTPEPLGFCPQRAAIATRVVPGSYYWFCGSGLAPGSGQAEGAANVFRAEVLETRVLLEDRPLLLNTVYPSAIEVQVPFEQLPGRHTVRIEGSHSMLEAAAVSCEVVPRAVTLIGRVMHWNFREVSENEPARSEEYLTAYLTGLGPVQPALESGLAAMDDRHRLVQPVSCHLGSRELEVVYAGLAPSLVGVYQVVVRLPVDLPETLEQAVLSFDEIETPIWVRR